MTSVSDIKHMVIKSNNTERTPLHDQIIMIYGDKKVGKSTVAAQFPDPVFLDCEGGLRTVHTPDGTPPDRVPINSWDDMRDALVALDNEHDYRTVVVDGMNELYNWAKMDLYKEHNVMSMNEGPLAYGKGKEIMGNRFREWFRALRNLDMGIVLCAHDAIETFNHNGTDYDKRIPYIDDTKDHVGWNVIKPSINMVLYAHKASKDGVTKHVMRTKGTPLVEAGDPYGVLPEVMPLDYDELYRAMESN